ncbi:MAG: TRAP transporter substrate-binding protein DctP [Calditrichaeota bacterium]|nr:TRAP transporter substrate-binding protein DctP [Calditrichota bacterium]HQU72585.1 TRAP transporter substrate-binding protein DctP [Calditrichia bacterium]
MKKIILAILFLSAIAWGQTIKFATLAPEGSTYLKVMRQLDEEIRAATDGRVKFKIYPGGVQGDEKDVVRKMRINQIHSAGFTGVGLGEILPEERILELPMLFNSYEEVDFVTSQLYDEFAAKFEEKGFVILGWADVGFAYVYSKNPIRTIEDLRKSKIWMWEGDPVAEATFKALNVAATPLALTDVLTSLQTNLVEAVYSPALPTVTLQWHTKVDYMMNLPLANVSGAVLISKKRFEELSAEDQQTLRDLGRQRMKELVLKAREDNDKSVDLMLKNGIKMVEIDPAAVEIFKTAARQAHSDLVGKLYDRALLDRVYGTLKTFREKKAAK